MCQDILGTPVWIPGTSDVGNGLPWVPFPLWVFDVLRISEALTTVTAMVGEGKEITDWCRWAIRAKIERMAGHDMIHEWVVYGCLW